MPAILFGSIGTLADTSELQRESFNRAFAAHGLDWRWEREEYIELLQGSGGAGRIRDVAARRGEEVDADAVHATKSQLFQEALASADVQPRPGVVDTLRDAREAGFGVALVTTTSTENVDALLGALAPEVGRDAFDLVLDVTDVDAPKPDPAAYRLARERLGEAADAVVAVEDNVGGARAADADGIACVAFPTANTASHDFAAATRQVDHLSFSELRGLIPAA